MAIPKVCGIETEYGIVVRGGDSNPVSASSLLINAYVNATSRKVGWDFEDETPANDARGFNLDDVFAPEIETSLVNAVLPNGARYYVDHAHPEISNPETTTAAEAVRWDRAADEIVRASMTYARELAPGRRRARGLQEQLRRQGQLVRVPRELPRQPRDAVRTDRVAGDARTSSPARCSRGAGKVGCEQPGREPADVPYQLSQRADFFEEEVGLETTLKRPIVNTRDEPHCDPQKYRRLHVIVGDANMSEVATYLKVGTTAIVLAMIEDNELGDEWLLASPVPAIRQVSHDPTLRRTIMLRDGRRATAIEIQWGLLRAGPQVRAGARSRSRRRGRRARRAGPLGAGAHRPRARPAAASPTGSTGWPSSASSTGTPPATTSQPGSAKLKAIDLQYHDMRADRCLAAAGRARHAWSTPADAVAAMTEPPTTTRAYFRGKCLQKFPNDVVAANWDSLVFDIGRDPLRRVPMMEPLRGTAQHVANLIEQSATAAELLERLGA